MWQLSIYDWLFTCWRTVTCDAVCNWCPGLFVRSSSRYLPSLTCFVCYCFSFFCLQSSVCARTHSSCCLFMMFHVSYNYAILSVIWQIRNLTLVAQVFLPSMLWHCWLGVRKSI